MPRLARPAYERVKPRLAVDASSGCWLWPGAQTYRDGYGIVGVTVGGKQTTQTVHRVVWEAIRGPIPDGLELDHLCRVRLCANPDHLEVVTHAENKRRAAGETCNAGHPRNEENSTRRKTDGALICRPCARAGVKKSRLRKKQSQDGGTTSCV